MEIRSKLKFDKSTLNSINMIKNTDFYKRIGYNLNVMHQSACLAINPIMVDSFAALFNCMPLDRASDYDGLDLKLFILVGWDRSFRLLLGPPGLN